jgi:hypothetical protein
MRLSTKLPLLTAKKMAGKRRLSREFHKIFKE